MPVRHIKTRTGRHRDGGGPVDISPTRKKYTSLDLRSNHIFSRETLPGVAAISVIFLIRDRDKSLAEFLRAPSVYLAIISRASGRYYGLVPSPPPNGSGGTVSPARVTLPRSYRRDYKFFLGVF
ncbi:hypothetical protein GWI33_015689 [Rhynchophorus ferrugineus]|uniref:Uncharacterized protein n=1 Tax=Rhynchophorus ferrugineus TaxID=354439 RepID=A0A834I2S3_RHYFE|nr:hypothetical protein GWI33_015689 [Rhynchophorus ferrugineus]